MVAKSVIATRVIIINGKIGIVKNSVGGVIQCPIVPCWSRSGSGSLVGVPVAVDRVFPSVAPETANRVPVKISWN